jgi:hypothetical protein
MFIVISNDGTQLSEPMNDRKQAEMEACWIAQLTAWSNAQVVETAESSYSA